MQKHTDLLKNILTDIKVEVGDMFDQNFARSSFFGDKWAPRKNPKAKNALLIKTGRLRRSLRGSVGVNSVSWKSDTPYAAAHNQGGKVTQSVPAHSRMSRKGKSYTVKAHSRTFTIPRRQFVGNHPEVKAAVERIANKNISEFLGELANTLKK